MSTETTKVIFRKWQGEIIAIFPEIVGTNTANTCMMFEHIGQHGAGDPYHVISQSKLATPAEYEHLKRELESAPYKYELQIIKRHRVAHRRARRAELERLRG